MFLKVEQGLSGLPQTVLMRQPGGRMIRVRMPIVLRKRGMRGLGVTCPAGLVQAANGGCIDPGFAPNKNNVQAAAPKAVNYASAPGCNVVNLATNECMLDDGTITGCNIIQECDSLTGNGRCQYGPFPGQAADPTLPFCSGSGPSVAYTPNPNLTNPTGPSTPFTPTKVFAANSGVVLPAGSQASIAPSSGAPSLSSTSSPASSSTPAAPANQQTNFLQQLLSGPNPPAGGSNPTTVVVQSGGGFFSESADIFGVQIPYWLIGVVVIGGGYLLMRGGKK
jgi:hypothetical protein